MTRPPRIALAAGAWVDHEPAWLSADEADGVLAALATELRWEQRPIVLFGRSVVPPRLIAWAGTVGRSAPAPVRYTDSRIAVRDMSGVKRSRQSASRGTTPSLARRA